MTPEELAAERAKYGIPAEGFSQADSQEFSTTNRLSELDAAWNQPQPTMMDKITEGATKVANAAGFGGVVDTLGNSIANLQNLADPKKSVKDKLATAENLPQNTMKQGIGSAAQVASLFAPAASGASLAGRMGVAALSGAAGFGGKAAAENQSNATVGKETLKGGAIGAGMVLGGEAVKKAGEAVYKAVIPYSAQEAKLVQSYKANVPFLERVKNAVMGESTAPRTVKATSFDQGLIGTENMLGVQGTKAKSNIWETVIKPALKASTQKVSMPEYFDAIQKKIIEDTPELSRQKELLAALDALKADYKGVGTVNLEKLQQFKEGWAKFIPDKAYKGKPIAGSFREVQDLAADLARQTIYKALGPEVRQAYFDYGNLKAIQELGQKAMTGGKFRGGAGSFISALKDYAVTPVATIGGQTLYKVGYGLELIGKSGAQTAADLITSMISGAPQSFPQPTDPQTPDQVSSSDQPNILAETIKGIPGEMQNPTPGSPLARAREFMQSMAPANPEEAAKQGLIPIDPKDPSKGYMDMTMGMGSMENMGKKFLSKYKPPYSFLKDAENFLDWIRTKKVPQGYKDGTLFEADFRNAVKNFHINPDLPTNTLTSLLESILKAADHHK